MANATERVKWYRRRFRYLPPQAAGNKLYGIMMIGNNYRRDNRLYGSYPYSYLDRVYALFPELPRLHVFSGLVRDPEGTTFDINPEFSPDVVGNVMDIAKYFPSGQFATVLADPPYNDKARRLYDTKPFNKRRAVIELAKVVRPGGHLLWLDITTPMWSKEQWRWGGVIDVHTGTNCVIRGLSILRRIGDRSGLLDS